MTGRLSKAKRVVIKIGSSLLVDQQSGDLRRDWLDALMDDVAAAREQGQDVLVVSSGAIALGRRSLGLGTRVLRLEDSQAAAEHNLVAEEGNPYLNNWAEVDNMKAEEVHKKAEEAHN